MKEDEVSLQVDDIIFVVEKCEDGWFIGQLPAKNFLPYIPSRSEDDLGTVLRTGQFGTFPGNYVERH